MLVWRERVTRMRNIRTRPRAWSKELELELEEEEDTPDA